jgi:hypothetical protein
MKTQVRQYQESVDLPHGSLRGVTLVLLHKDREVQKVFRLWMERRVLIQCA